MSSEETALALPAPENLRLVALDPAALQNSQKELIGWTNRKIVEVQGEVDDFDKNLQIAKASKWNTARPKAALRFAIKRLEFYEKIRDALMAGFYIVPNFPCDIFAIRTNAAKPSQSIRTHHQWEALPDETGKLLSSGVGDYKNPERFVHTTKAIEKDSQGKDQEIFYKKATAFQDMDFPFVLAKPQVLNATQRAMALKIFDEIGVCPQTKKSDPLVIGKIKQLKRDWTQKEVSFLVAWFLDTETL